MHYQPGEEEEGEEENRAFLALLGAVGAGKMPQDIDWLKQKFREVLLKKDDINNNKKKSK